jgi:hypothetical protein
VVKNSKASSIEHQSINYIQPRSQESILKPTKRLTPHNVAFPGDWNSQILLSQKWVEEVDSLVYASPMDQHSSLCRPLRAGHVLKAKPILTSKLGSHGSLSAIAKQSIIFHKIGNISTAR